MIPLDPTNHPVTVVDWVELAEHDRDGQRKIVDIQRAGAEDDDDPAWVSSALHAAHTRAGVARLTQWRTAAELRAHRAGESNRLAELAWTGPATEHRMLAAELVSVQQAPSVTGGVDITTARDDWTSIAIQWVAPQDQDTLVTELTRPREEWVHLLPGYRSHSVLRGLDGTFVINYAQWESKRAYWAFHDVPEHVWPPDVRASRDRARRLTTAWEYDTFRVVHSRTARRTDQF
ncbi:antibiotic biosynthesis monooxygenase [Streptomyces sp. SID10815]|uniref:antibiotic biosynthesis monooxygenase n=1 Tax=Streptomyces sp. SID10815 TaxID=2706027 RepID=UPI0013C80371|nr:antibiotic biosynthesis monooxygenase [Streptomyces sp. SID10815]NEA47949.1 antibiotic biosynthesis monooxygenase [Streptomyces sp. SID10815]